MFATLARHPRLLRRLNALGGLFIAHGSLPERERELVILRVAWRSGSAYEWGQHTVLGRQAGLSDDEVARVAGGCGWSDDDRVLLELADELVERADVSDGVWLAVAKRFDEAQLLELLLLPGFYRMLAGYLNAVRVQPEPELPGWPDRPWPKGGPTPACSGAAPPAHWDAGDDLGAAAGALAVGVRRVWLAPGESLPADPSAEQIVYALSGGSCVVRIAGGGPEIAGSVDAIVFSCSAGLGPPGGGDAALDDAEAVEFGGGATVEAVRRDLGQAAGSRASGLKHLTVAPGKLSAPPHCHSAEEEFFVVLDGEGTLLIGDEEHPVRAGSLVARPAGSRVAHAFRAGADGLVCLAYGMRVPDDVTFYPRSGKFFLRGVGLVGRVEPLSYWDGEE